MTMNCNIPARSVLCKDNLEVLRGINASCIDLIYLDPPFNKKKEFAASTGSIAEGASFSDVFREEDIKEEWLQAIHEDNKELRKFLMGVKDLGNPYNFAYLVYMAIRLIEMHRVLKDTGSLYLHCDSTMSHYLKILLDCVFGEKNFRNEIIWWYKGTGSPKYKFPQKNDVIFYYAKSASSTHHTIDIPGAKKSGWTGKETKSCDAVWEINTVFQSNERSTATGYPTQKPLVLLERIIKASSNEGDIVLDPFCGSGTTCVAAERLNRRWIGIDTSIQACELVEERVN